MSRHPYKFFKKDYGQFYECLRLSSGMISTAAKKFGINRQTVLNRMKEDPEFAQGVEDVKESIRDFGEAALLTKIKEGDTSAIIFFAKTQLKDRGYCERVEISGKDGDAIETNNRNTTTLVNMTMDEINEEIGRLDKLNGETK